MNIKNEVKSMLEQILLSNSSSSSTSSLNKEQETEDIKTNRLEFMNIIWDTLRIKSIEEVNINNLLIFFF